MKTKALPQSDYRKLSDEELVHRYSTRREPAAMNQLFERYGHLVYGVALGLLKNAEGAKDAMQQVFIQTLDDLVRFQVKHFKSWIYRVTRNHCLMQLRRGTHLKGTVLLDEASDDWDVEVEDGVHPKEAEEARYQQLEAALEDLNTEQRTCIDLFYLQRLTYSEVAERTGYTIPAVKSHLQNGRRNLKMKLTTGAPAGTQ